MGTTDPLGGPPDEGHPFAERSLYRLAEISARIQDIENSERTPHRARHVQGLEPEVRARIDESSIANVEAMRDRLTDDRSLVRANLARLGSLMDELGHSRRKTNDALYVLILSP